MARFWTDVRSELVADGLLDEREVDAARTQFLSELLDAEHAASRGAADSVRTKRRSSGAGSPRSSSESVVGLATRTLSDPRASKLQKCLAASALEQRDRACTPPASVRRKAAMVLRGTRYAEVTRKLAASVISNGLDET